jgi:hypothetical protein
MVTSSTEAETWDMNLAYVMEFIEYMRERYGHLTWVDALAQHNHDEMARKMSSGHFIRPE